ncbi:MAG: CDP-alcohol phosphatidyltransferase family protein [Calditrichaeota bacterium]|nr:MAG: CDP-alcohol phosphatidyltransferase family protein [Calditrichota bacterium]
MESIKSLKDKIAKSSVSHYAPLHDVIVRKISVYFTWLLLLTPITANGTTVLQGIVGVIGAFLLIYPDYLLCVIGILLLQLGYILDCCDGEIARYYKTSSVNGVFLDLIGHEIVIPMMYFCISVGEFQRTGVIWFLLLGFSTAFWSLRFDIAAMFQTINVLFAKSDNPSYSYEKLKTESTSRATQQATQKPSFVRTLFRYPESMNVLTLLLFLDWFIPNFLPLNLSLVSIFLIVFGTLVPFARLYSIYKIFSGNEVEKRYTEIIETARKILNKK